MGIKLGEQTVTHIVLFLIGHMIAATVFVFHMYIEVNDLRLQYNVTNQVVQKAITNLEAIRDSSNRSNISMEVMSQKLEIFLKQHTDFREEMKQELKLLKAR